MKALLLGLVLISSHVFAFGYKTNTTRFIVSSFTADGGRVFYNCRSVERATLRMLKQLGAKKTRVRCRGGLDPLNGFSTEAVVRASFQSLDASIAGNISTSLYDESFNHRTDCHLYNTIFDSVKKDFEISSYNVDRCFRSGDRTRIRAEVIKEIK